MCSPHGSFRPCCSRWREGFSSTECRGAWSSSSPTSRRAGGRGHLCPGRARRHQSARLDRDGGRIRVRRRGVLSSLYCDHTRARAPRAARRRQRSERRQRTARPRADRPRGGWAAGWVCRHGGGFGIDAASFAISATAISAMTGRSTPPPSKGSPLTCVRVLTFCSLSGGCGRRPSGRRWAAWSHSHPSAR